jgi:hypothetical protein
MKKVFSFIGALFLGSAAFAQGSKTDSANKTISRKVLDSDVKNLPADPSSKNTIDGIKGNTVQKGKGDNLTIKSNEKMPVTEKQHYTIKLTNASKTAAADSAAHIKMPGQKN